MLVDNLKALVRLTRLTAYTHPVSSPVGTHVNLLESISSNCGLESCVEGLHRPHHVSPQQQSTQLAKVYHGKLVGWSPLMQVDRRFAGIYSFTATLLFTNYHGLEHQTTAWQEGKLLISLQIMFWFDNQTLSRRNLEMCTKNDFKLKSWSGRWSQLKGNASCKVNHQGRYLCLDLEEECKAPWCEGPLGILESNGWGSLALHGCINIVILKHDVQ